MVIIKSIIVYDKNVACPSMDRMTGSVTSIPCERRTSKRLKSEKCSGETWNSLPRNMYEQYDPDH